MSRSDWYTHSTWTNEDAEQFWSRLRRTRKPQMAAQYVRIQAQTLEQQGLFDEALMLLEYILANYPESFDLAQVHHQIASCCEKKGQVSAAVGHLRSALRIESQNPSYLTHAWLSLGRVAVEHGLRELYPEFLSIAEAKEAGQGGLECHLVFPIDRYEFFSILAIISRDKGDLRNARVHAISALAVADLKHSGFRYHAKIGLVRKTDTPLYRDVQKIAGQ